MIAEPTKAKEKAITKVRRVIDVFRFSIPFLYNDSQKINIAIFGELSRQVLHTLIISENKDSYSRTSDLVGLHFSYELSTENIIHLKQIGAFKIFKILSKNSDLLNEFEETLLRAIHWFAEHTVQKEVESKFLHLVIALETILTAPGDAPIGMAIAEGVALLLLNDLESRKRLKASLKKLYGLRSKIAHGGKKGVTDKDFLNLRHIVINLIVLLIQKLDIFTTRKDLLEWIEDRKLS